MNDNQYEGADTSVCTYTVTYTIPWACGAYDNMQVLGVMSTMAIQIYIFSTRDIGGR